ncbi:hypothetical protein F4604DRAFT_1933286 [Suillus subluteus]|nr:hypothetical protein F4604DRAFT_1933286 [Suillus subluteus]
MPGTTIINSQSSHSYSPAASRRVKKIYRLNLDEDTALKGLQRPPKPVTRSATRRGEGLTKESPTAQALPPQAGTIKNIKPPVVKNVQSDYFLREPARLPTRGKVHKVLRFISRVNREQEFAVFYNIGQAEYNLLLRNIEELPQKPRLAYYANQRKLVIEMPGDIHETIVNIIRSGIEDVATAFQRLIPRWLILCHSHPNVNIITQNLTFIPDFVHAINSCTDPPHKTHPVFCEVGSSQSETDLLQRMRDVVSAYPDAVLIIMGLIKETPPYGSPAIQSQAWQTLGQESSVRSQVDFLSMRTGARSLDRPTKVVVGGHCWCEVSAVSFQVWIRGNAAIDIDTQDPQLTARGTLFPHETMDNVTTMIERGLSLMRDRYVDISLIADPHANLDALRAAQVTLPFDWNTITYTFTYSTQDMAYGRYVAWYRDTVKGANQQVLVNDGPAMYTRSRTSGRPSRGRGGGLPRRGRKK